MKKYTPKQKMIIDELYQVDYFYTRYTSRKEDIAKKFNVSIEYMDKLIENEITMAMMYDTMQPHDWYEGFEIASYEDFKEFYTNNQNLIIQNLVLHLEDLRK